MEQGANLVTGGERDGNFYSATLLTDISEDNDAYHEEFFGPVAAVYRVGSEDEAIELANDTPFGLGSYIYTTDSEQALRVADRIEAGMVFVNAVGAESAELPFGGVKRSGFGRELGRFGADEFVNKKLIRVGDEPGSTELASVSAPEADQGPTTSGARVTSRASRGAWRGLRRGNAVRRCDPG